MTVSKEQVKSAPNMEMEGEELSQTDEGTLYHHYQLNYIPPDSTSGRRLARRWTLLRYTPDLNGSSGALRIRRAAARRRTRPAARR